MARFLHTSIFVNDLAESIAFYEKLGLTLLDGPLNYPGNCDMAFVGHSWDAYVELIFDLEEHPPYAAGNRFEHLAIEIDGTMDAYVAGLHAKGIALLRGPKSSPGGLRTIAFVRDPNGVEVELLEARPGAVT